MSEDLYEGPYEGMTNEDVEPYDWAEEERTATLRLDAQDEERQLAEEQAAEAAAGPDEGCQAEFIDGSWYGDDCDECRQQVQDEMDECWQCENEDYCSKHENGVYS